MCRKLWTWIIILFCFQYCCMYTVVIVFLTILHQRIAFLLLFHFHIWFDHLFDLCFFNTRIADNNFFWQLFVWAGKVGAGKIKKWWSFRPHSSQNFGAGKVVAGLTTYLVIWYPNNAIGDKLLGTVRFFGVPVSSDKRYPSDSIIIHQRRELWLARLNISDANIKTKYLVCNLHFVFSKLQILYLTHNYL